MPSKGSIRRALQGAAFSVSLLGAAAAAALYPAAAAAAGTSSGAQAAAGQVRKISAAAAELRDLMLAVQAFSASFRQELSAADGHVISEASGKIYMKRPQRFLMHTTEPDELVLYTRGSDIYYYDAAVNQLTVTSGGNLGDNPLMLLSDTQGVDWSSYEVRRDGSRFTLVPRYSHEVRSLTLSFVPAQKGGALTLLESLTIRMDDGNTNFYRFTGQTNSAKDSDFDFKPPLDTEVDDQRG